MSTLKQSGLRTILRIATHTFLFTFTSIGIAREWQDNSGDYRVEAEFVRVEGAKVILKKSNGQQIEVAINILSLADRKYILNANTSNPVQERTQNRREKKTVSPSIVRLKSGRIATGTGKLEFQEIDTIVDDFMRRVDCQAATIAIANGEQILYSRGYGWMDKLGNVPTHPNAVMRIASCSKPITKAVIKSLVASNKLSLSLPVFQNLGIAPAGPVVDPRLYRITVGDLLEHKGGFDGKVSFDPMFRTDMIRQELRLKTQVTPVNIIQYMLTQPLQINPGEKYCYSNFGYCVLGRVAEKVTGRPYIEVVQRIICQPLGIPDFYLSRNSIRERPASEVWYPVKDSAFCVDIMDSHGGITTSAISLCKFMQKYWNSGELREDGQRQKWNSFGSLPGTTAMMLQRPDGMNCAVLMNNRHNDYREIHDRLSVSINEALDRVNQVTQ